jgi:hypothetical protein
MKAIQRTLFLSSLLVLVLYSCTKDRKTRGCEVDQSHLVCKIDTDLVSIRVTNQTGFPICDFEIEYKKDSFITVGAIPERDSICFITVDSAMYSPGMTFKVGTTDFTVLLGSGGTTLIGDSNTVITYDIELKQRFDTTRQVIYYEPSSFPIIVHH